MSQETIEYHYGRHLQTYIDNLNNLIAGTPYEKMALDDIVMNASGPTFNNAAQVWNHTFFFESLTPERKLMPLELKDYLIRDFGSVESFKEEFNKAATGLFGSGWVWLAQDGSGKLHIIQEQNAGNPLRNGYKPLLTIDVWEHAYYIDYRNKRAEFVNRCWELFDWDKVIKRMHKQLPMRNYICVTCGWVYEPAEGDPENGIPPGTPFSDLPDDWTCPACGVGKEYFEPER